MPPEPKRPIEELLEASAKARRMAFGADAKMPNPMRARLHEEVARVERGAQPRERRSWLATFWPQISIATAVAAVLLTGSVLWVAHKRESSAENMQLAMGAPVGGPREPSEALKSLQASPRLAARSKAAPSSARLGESAVTGGDLSAKAQPGAAVEPEARREASDTDALEKFADGTIAAAPEPRSEPTNPKAEDGAMAAPAQTFASGGASAAAPVAAGNQIPATPNRPQQFSQTTRARMLRSNTKAKEAGGILNTFQVEQNGSEIRVVDADGSTYTGKLQQLTQDKPQNFAAPTSAGRAARDTAISENQLSFRATGYNASLKKSVVFEGNYIPSSPNEQKRNAGDRAVTPEQATAARIVGTAKIQGEPPVEIDATTTAR